MTSAFYTSVNQMNYVIVLCYFFSRDPAGQLFLFDMDAALMDQTVYFQREKSAHRRFVLKTRSSCSGTSVVNLKDTSGIRDLMVASKRRAFISFETKSSCSLQIFVVFSVSRQI